MPRLVHEIDSAGIETTIDYDGSSLEVKQHVATRYDQNVLDKCKEVRSIHQVGRHYRWAAETPLLLNKKWQREFVEKGYDKTMKWGEFKAMKLNSREYQNLRCGYKRSGSMKL